MAIPFNCSFRFWRLPWSISHCHDSRKHRSYGDTLEQTKTSVENSNNVLCLRHSCDGLDHQSCGGTSVFNLLHEQWFEHMSNGNYGAYSDSTPAVCKLVVSACFISFMESLSGRCVSTLLQTIRDKTTRHSPGTWSLRIHDYFLFSSVFKDF